MGPRARPKLIGTFGQVRFLVHDLQQIGHLPQLPGRDRARGRLRGHLSGDPLPDRGVLVQLAHDGGQLREDDHARKDEVVHLQRRRLDREWLAGCRGRSENA